MSLPSNTSVETIAPLEEYPALERTWLIENGSEPQTPTTLTRRDFLRSAGGAAVLAVFPWSRNTAVPSISLVGGRLPAVGSTDYIASLSDIGDMQYLGLGQYSIQTSPETEGLYEKLNSGNLLRYTSEGLDTANLNSVVEQFASIRSQHGLTPISMLTPEQQFMVAFWTSLNHSESTWAVLPDPGMVPQMVTSDVMSRRAGIRKSSINDVLSPIMPANGFAFSALRGLNPATVHKYIAAKGNQFMETGYAAMIMQKHQDIAINALMQHQQGLLDRSWAYYYPHFAAQKIFDPVNDGSGVADVQVAWIKQNPQARALGFSRYDGELWYIVGERVCNSGNSVTTEDKLSKYEVSLNDVIKVLYGK